MTAAARMCRDRARVVAVGFVPHGLPREIAYPKELALRISRSYGPGRYDAAFEEHGVDYPIGYVRWTETRNLEAFLHLLSTGQVTTSDLITDRMPIDRAASAYDRLLDKHGPRPVGMVIDYAAPPEPAPAPRPRPVAAPIPGRIGLAFVGAGSFAKGVLLPTFSADDRATLRTVCTAHGLTAWDAQKRFGFAEATTDLDHVWSDPDVRLVVITTRHDRHADLAVRALEAGKHVFVEKPLAIDAAGLERVAEAARRGPGLLLVGFNRRFAPQAVAARAALAGLGPVFVHCRVNAGALPAGHWIDDPTVGGGRMIGEGCHFVDLASALCGDPPIAGVQARALGRPVGLPEDFAVQVSFSDGSVAQITYLSRGAPSLAKERIEAHAGGVSVVIDDWRSCEVHAGGRVRRTKGGGKGHEAEISALLAAVARGGPSPIPLEVLLRVTETTFRVHTALAEPC
jgi:predicted dehydrogenase